jgi:hypothetical protein
VEASTRVGGAERRPRADDDGHHADRHGGHRPKVPERYQDSSDTC